MVRRIILSIFLMSFTTALAYADNADVLRESQDRAEIEALMWRYVRALDTLNEDAYAAVFTEDGRFGNNGEQGHAALKEMITGLKSGRAEREAQGEAPSQPMHHMIVNHHIEFVDEDNALYHSYWMTVFAGSGADIPVNVAAAGRGIDELVRHNGQWLIHFRDVAPQD